MRKGQKRRGKGRCVIRKARGGLSGGRNMSRFYFRPRSDKIYSLRFIVSSDFYKVIVDNYKSTRFNFELSDMDFISFRALVKFL